MYYCYDRSAASKAVMQGRHFAQVTYMMFGVIRPGWDVEGGMNTHTGDGHCFYGTHFEWRMPGSTSIRAA